MTYPHSPAKTENGTMLNLNLRRAEPSRARSTQPLPPGIIPAKTADTPAQPRGVESALALARELMYAIEQYILPTPDLDTDRFLNRLRGTAANVVGNVDAPTLELYRQWSKGALQAFAGLQTRYIIERETEMWRLLCTYADAIHLGRQSDAELISSLRASNESLREAAKMEDIRAVREAIQSEVQQARRMVERKMREDSDRTLAMTHKVHRLEAELAAIRGRACYDALSGLLHRGAFDERLEKCVADGKPHSLAVIDLDNFRTINNTLGHLVGDKMIVTVSDLLRRGMRQVDILGRYGGDEFMVLAPMTPADQLGNRLGQVLSRRHVKIETDNGACSAQLSVSVGVAQFEIGDSPSSLINRADEALLTIKKRGKGGVRVLT
jgi:diguanylate cyclase